MVAAAVSSEVAAVYCSRTAFAIAHRFAVFVPPGHGGAKAL
jgi:hypothetical protein